MVITITNNKGGVGKTTSAANIGSALNLQGYDVLLVDFDPQANLSLHFGVNDPVNNIYRMIAGDKIQLHTIRDGFKLIPSHYDLNALSSEIANEIRKFYFLKEEIEKIKNNYHYVIIDCPPSLETLTYNALTASDNVIVPMSPEYFSMQGLNRLYDTINDIKIYTNPNIRVQGIFMTKFNKNVILHKECYKQINKHYPKALKEQTIRQNIALAECQTHHKCIYEYNEHSNGANDYINLTNELFHTHLQINPTTLN